MSISICGHLRQENSASQERTYQYKFAFAVARRLYIYYFMTSRGMTFFEISSCMPEALNFHYITLQYIFKLLFFIVSLSNFCEYFKIFSISKMTSCFVFVFLFIEIEESYKNRERELLFSFSLN